MNADLTSLIAAGLLAILIATTALVMLVRGDLAPEGLRPMALSTGGRFLLGAALGLGVIAFSIKVVIILTLASFPQQTISPLIAEVGQSPLGASEQDNNPLPDPEPYEWKALPAVAPAPLDNPVTPAKVALGERLFHDTALSRDRTLSCASCHDVRNGAGTDSRPTALGIDGTIGSRNSPTVWNAAYQARLFWDGRARSLEEQAMGPPVNPAEMGMPNFAAIEDRIATDPSYHDDFARAFGPREPITMQRIAQAIASYERTLVTTDAPYDRFIAGDDGALNAAQKRGMWLFQSSGCIMCHAGPNFSGASQVGPRNPFAPLYAKRSAVAARYDLTSDKGKAAPGSEMGVWRIPSLRNVALTAPYFHNGSVGELREAVKVMATAQLGATISDDPQMRRTPRWSPERRQFDTLDRLVLSNHDLDDIVAFLNSLSSDTLASRVRIAEGGK
ncbi:MAG: cytochrome-c peroxidase [Bacteroidales bacterium]